MLTEFQQSLANTLGSRLPAPYTGRVAVGGASIPGTAPHFFVIVGATELLLPDIGSPRRSEIVPGAADPRRIVRLRCFVDLVVLGETRLARLPALDAALYALDAPDFLAALTGAAPDPGFLLQTLHLVSSEENFEQEAFVLHLQAEGWFWPVGQVGQAGVTIGEIRVRGVSLPFSVTLPIDAALLAGGAAVPVTINVGTIGPYRLAADDLPDLPFGSLALTLIGPGAQPGAGSLSGGAVGVDGSQLVAMTAGTATVTYTPPAAAARDTLVIALDDGEDGAGIEIGRYVLEVY